MKKTYVVIGSSAAGIGALNKLRTFDSEATIICITDEQEWPYNKCVLADFLSETKTVDQVYTKPQQFFDDNRITLQRGVTVTAIDRAAQHVVTNTGETIGYTALLLAVGGKPYTPSVAHALQGVFSFYTLNDTLALKEWLARSETKHVVVVGSGLTGLEAADAMGAYNVSVTVVEKHNRVLARHTDLKGSAFIAQCMQQNGINLICSVTVDRLIEKEGVVTQVLLSDGIILPADMVIFALGAGARLELANQAQLQVQDGAMVTNEFLQTSDPHIWAAGDCALVIDQLYTGCMVKSSTWPDAMQQGMIAASNMVGQPRAYKGVALTAHSAFFGQTFSSGGCLSADQEGLKEIFLEDTGYHKLILDQDNVVKGGIFIGERPARLVEYRRSLTTGATLSPLG